METASLIANNDPNTVQVMRRILNSSVGMDLAGRMGNEAKLTTEFLKPPPPTESFKEFLSRNPPESKKKEKT